MNSSIERVLDLLETAKGIIAEQKKLVSTIEEDSVEAQIESDLMDAFEYVEDAMSSLENTYQIDLETEE